MEPKRAKAFDRNAISWHFVNLASRPDRREHAEEQFAHHGIEAHRFEAYLPDQWPGDPAKVERMRKRTPGAIGCYYSQTEVIRTVVGTDRIVAVCEDDVVFCQDLNERLRYIEEHLTWDWDIFYLGATFHVPGQWCHHDDCKDWGLTGCDVEPTSDPRIMRTYGIWGTYAYLVNGRNAEKVLRLFDENVHRSDGIDHLAIILGNRLSTYCFVPGCAWQYDNESNIGTGVTQFSLFKHGPQALGPYVWTDYMHEFDATSYDWEKGLTQ